MLLNRELCKSTRAEHAPRFDAAPLQVGMGKDAWRVAVASMLLCRARRAQAAPCLQELLLRWPNAASLCYAEGLEQVLRPCGLQRNRARQIQRFCTQWLGDGWEDLRELTGVGPYVADAVSVFCFGCTEITCSDKVLLEYARRIA